MNSQNLALVAMTLEGKLSRQDILLVLQQCENLDDSSFSLLYTINLKKPLFGLLFQWVLGFCGGGRFYKGDIMRGVLYILAFIVICVLFGAGAVVADESGDESLLGVSVMLGVVFYIVLLADFYFIYKGIQRDNLQKITQALAFAKKKKPNLE